MAMYRGQEVFMIAEHKGKPRVASAIFVRQRSAWYRFRNPDTGEEWNERGCRWSPSPSEALRSYITAVIRDIGHPDIAAMFWDQMPIEHDVEKIIRATREIDAMARDVVE